MTSFEDRQRNLFNQLNEAEKQANFVTRSTHDNDLPERRIVRKNLRQTRAEMRQFRGKESIFKRPEAPLAACVAARKLPGFRKDPDKWVCYNLENVPDISDCSNTQAAAICLDETVIKDKGQTSEDAMETSESKVTFIKPIPKPKTSPPGSDKAVSYKNSIVIYPEHIVGVKQKAVQVKKHTPEKNTTNTNLLRLDHLHNDDDNECD